MRSGTILLVVLGAPLGACGGSAVASSTGPTGDPAAAPADPAGRGLDALYVACGLWTTKDAIEAGLTDKPDDELTDDDYERLSRDPAMQPPADPEACMAFVRGAVADRSTVEVVVGASDVAYALCAGELANGEACYYKALFHQIPIWEGTATQFEGENVVLWLDAGCELGHAPSCAILETGTDTKGRSWARPKL
jgi:hypothetical protein